MIVISNLSQLDNKEINTNQNKNNTSSTDDFHSCLLTQKKYSVWATSKTTRLTPLNTTPPLENVELQKTNQLTPAGKEYLFSHINRRSYHAVQCVKSQILNKDIDSILYIVTPEKYVVIKCMLQLLRLENNIKTIGIDQSIRNRSYFEHKCLNNIKNIYQHAGKCDDQ